MTIEEYKNPYGVSANLGPIEGSSSSGVYHPNSRGKNSSHNNCPVPELSTNYSLDAYRKCSNSIVFDGLPKASINVGFEAYFIVGMTANFGFDVEYFTEQIIYIYEEE